MDKIEDFFKDKKILILGFGREGRSTYNFIINKYPNMLIDIADKENLDLRKFKNARNIDYECLENVINKYDIVMKSPGISFINKNIETQNIFSQTELFLKHFKDQVIGITGTKGKSTTSSLLYHILKSSIDNVLFVGNIGKPCLDYVNEIDDDTIIVFELSCHQLEYTAYSPHISVLLNLYEDHLDHYGTFENYVKAKYNIFKYQNNNDILIVNTECQNINKNVIYASLKDENATIFALYDAVKVDGKVVIHSNETNLLGIHNLYNIGIVYYICTKIYNVSDSEFKKYLLTFKGLSHRLEYVGTVDDILYFDDSISTTCESCISAINSIPNIGTLLIGGMDRGINYEKLVNHILKSNIDNVILMPDTSSRLEKMFKERSNSNINILISKDLSDAVRLAKLYTKKGKACVLSPAAASYGFFKNFEERGDEFKRLVSLKK